MTRGLGTTMDDDGWTTMDGRRIDDEWMTNGRHWTTMDDDCHDDCHLTNKDVINMMDNK